MGDTIKNLLRKRFGIKSASDFLVSDAGKNPKIDTTPRIDGVPVVSMRDISARFAKLKFL